MNEKRLSQHRMVLRGWKIRIVEVRARFKDIEQTACFASNEGSRIARTMGECEGVRCAAPTRCRYFGPRRGGRGMQRSQFDVFGAWLDDRSGIEHSTTRVVEIGLDRSSDARTDCAVVGRHPIASEVPYAIWEFDLSARVGVNGSDCERVQRVARWKNPSLTACRARRLDGSDQSIVSVERRCSGNHQRTAVISGAHNKQQIQFDG